MPEIEDPVVRSRFLQLAGLPDHAGEAEPTPENISSWDSFLSSAGRELQYLTQGGSLARDYSPNALKRPLETFDARNMRTYGSYSDLPPEVAERAQSMLAQAVDADHYNAIEEEVRNDLERQRIASANPVAGALGAVGGSVIDPLTWGIPVAKFGKVVHGLGAASRLSRYASSGLKVGLSTAAAATFSEALLHASDITRTREESIANVTGAFLFGGALGAGIPAYSAERIRKASEMIVDTVRIGKLSPETLPEVVKKALLDLDYSGARSTGAAAAQFSKFVTATARGIENLPDKNWLDKLARTFFAFSPFGRSLRSPYQAMVFLGQLLSDSPAIMKRMEGVKVRHSVETAQQIAISKLAMDVALPVDRIWEKFLKDNPGNTTFGNIFSRRLKFNEEVGIAMAHGGKAQVADAKAAAAIEEAATIANKHVDALDKEAIRTGQRQPWEKVVGEPYFHRMYDVPKVAEERDQFVATLIARRIKNGMDPAEAAKLSEKNHESIVSGVNASMRFADDGVMGSSQNVGRTIDDVPTTDLLPWLAKDYMRVLFSMTRSQAARTALVDALRPLVHISEMDNLGSRIDALASKAASNVSGAKLSGKDLDELLDALEDLHDISAGQILKAYQEDLNIEPNLNGLLRDKRADRANIRAARLANAPQADIDAIQARLDFVNDELAKIRNAATEVDPSRTSHSYQKPKSGEALAAQLRGLAGAIMRGAARDAYELTPFLAKHGILARQHREAAKLVTGRRARRSLHKRFIRGKRDAMWMRDQLIGKRHGEEGDSRLTGALSKINFMGLMGPFQLSNMAEIIGTLKTSGFAPTAAAFLETFKNPIKNIAGFADSAIRGRSPKQLLAAARQKEKWVELAMAAEMAGGDLSRANSMLEIMETRGMSRVEALIHGGYRTARRAFFIDPMTAYTRGLNARAFLSGFYRDARRYLNDPEKYDWMKKIFESYRLDLDDLPDIVRFYEQFGDVKSILKNPNAEAWVGPGAEKAREALKMAMFNGINQATIRVSVGDRPRFLANPVAALIRQFTNFLSGAHNRILVSGLQQRDARIAQLVLGQFAIGMLQVTAKDLAAGRDPTERSTANFVDRVFDQTSFPGYLGQFLNTGQALFGQDLASAFSDSERGNSKFDYMKNLFSAMTGPTGNTAMNVADIIGAGLSLSPNETTLREINQTLNPIRDAWYLDLIFKKLESSAARAMGIPLDKKRRKASGGF